MGRIRSVPRYATAEALCEIESERAIEPLCQALRDKCPEVRRVAAANLGEFRTERAVEPLGHALRDKSRRVRFEAVFALGEIGSERAVEPLGHALRDKSRRVRWVAAGALGELGSERAMVPLLLAMTDRKKDVRSWAVSSVDRIVQERGIESLVQALRDKRPLVRKIAADTLGRIGNREAIEALEQAARDKRRLVRNAASKALEQIAQKTVLKQKFDEIQVSGLAEFGLKAQRLEPSVYWTRKEHYYVEFERIVEHLLRALGNKDARCKAAEALFVIGHEQAALDTLYKVLQEEVYGRLNAVSALGRIATGQAIPPLLLPNLILTASGDAGKEVCEAASRVLKRILCTDEWKPG